MIPISHTEATTKMSGNIAHLSFLLFEMRRIMTAIEIFVKLVEMMAGICAIVAHLLASTALSPR